MLAREQVANTYLGKGVAIPHGLPEGPRADPAHRHRRAPGARTASSGSRGIRPASSSASRPRSDEHLDILSNLTGLLYDDELVDRLAFTPDPREVIAALTAPRADAPASE